ncbi:hypothetical protein [Bremerella alba]|uniref:hypothetical protein n=1 Tax=Bremerella alba TaxID=980252 RepID=UPI001A955577|nr:hypothetical protein [Bremerella alba]
MMWAVLLVAILVFSFANAGDDFKEWISMTGYETATVVTSICSVFATLVAAFVAWYGPKMSVKLAHQMMESDNDKREVAKLIREITHDLDVFRMAVNDSGLYIASSDRWHRVLIHLSPLDSDYETERETAIQQRDREGMLAEKATTKALDYQAKLKSRQISVRLLFPDEGTDCAKAIENVINLDRNLSSTDPRDLLNFSKKYTDAISKVHDEMEKLYETLK